MVARGVGAAAVVRRWCAGGEVGTRGAAVLIPADRGAPGPLAEEDMIPSEGRDSAQPRQATAL